MDKRSVSPGIDSKKRSKTSSIKDYDSKRFRLDNDEPENHEDIARQYKKFQSAAKYDLNSDELFCICRKPDHDGALMISCDGCEEWFHAECMKIPGKYTPLIEKFYCKFCHWRENKHTRWSRKCRRPACVNAIRKSEKSKYCSEECGIKFLKSKLEARDLGITQGEMKFILDFCEDHETFRVVGTHFPELPEVKELDFTVLPQDIQKELTDIDRLDEKVNAEILLTEKKSVYHQATKEKIKLINEKVQQVQDPQKSADLKQTKKKKSGSKKVDLCCFQLGIDELFLDHHQSNGGSAAQELSELLNKVEGSFDTYSAFKSEIDECVDAFSEDTVYKGNLCLVDRRKCLRHNGWYNLLGDLLWKRLHELKAAHDEYNQKRSKTLRDYSISVHEADK